METRENFRNLTVPELLNIVEQRYGKWTSPLVAEIAARLADFHKAGYDTPDEAEDSHQSNAYDSGYEDAEANCSAEKHEVASKVAGVINALEESKPFDLLSELRAIEDRLDQ